MKKELKYEHQLGQEYIKEALEYCPAAKKFYAFVAEQLDCKIEELAFLSVHPDFECYDDEGWNVKSFFPKGSEIKVTHISYNYQVGEYAIGDVVEVIYESEKFIGESDASPWGFWAKYESK